MNKSIVVITTLGLFALLACQAQGVLFADNHIYLFEDGEKASENTILIDIPDSYPEIYTESVFIRSQIESTELTIYKTNETYLIPYHEWIDMTSFSETTYEMYIDMYINSVINESLYNITITLPNPEDNKTYGDVIGIYRYFNIDIKTGDVDMFDTKKPETPGFELILAVCAVLLAVPIWLKNK